MATVTVLLEVIERGTRANVLPLEERQIEFHGEWESRLFLEDRAKRAYLGEIESRAKYEPRLREMLNSRDWCIDCTSLN